MSILDIIEPIELLAGPHEDTARTGRGCVMNVIAYLNGEAQITDESPCVCFVARPFLIRLNDVLPDSERSRLIPFIERAMGSRNDDPAVFMPRMEKAIEATIRCAMLVCHDPAWRRWAEGWLSGTDRTAEAAARAAEAGAEAWASWAAARAAEAWASWAEAEAEAWASWAEAVAEAWISCAAAEATEDIFTLLDAILPKAVIEPPVVIQRAKTLVSINS